VRAPALRLPQPEFAYLPFVGGLDLETPPLAALPGTLRETQNFEVGINGRYRRIKGYERFDGQAAPSDAAYATINVTISGEFSVGDTVTGADSSATGVVVAVVTDVGDDDYLVITKISGTFATAGEDLEVSAVVEGTSSAGAVIDGASTPKLHAQYKNLAADEYRDDIAAPPGSGSVLGAFMLADVRYAWRNILELPFTSGGTTEPSVGDAISGLTSSASATLTGIALESGSWAGGDATGRLYFATQTGTFQSENCDIAGSTSNDFTIAGDSTSRSGLNKSSASGWTMVALGRELSFTSGGTTEIAEGDTIDGASSGAAATVTRVVLESGTWAAGTAAGRLIFASQTGTFQAENLDVGASTNLATIAADSSAITMSASGRHEVVLHNFGGQAGTKRAYGCDKVNRGYEFDGTVFAPIDSTMDTDTPTHVGVNKNHLFFAFAGSAQHSSPGFPYQWSPVVGASEIAVGADITAFQQEAGEGVEGGAFAIFTANSIHILYGNNVSDGWVLSRIHDQIGAREYSVTQAGLTTYLDDKGVKNLRATDRHGNFTQATLTRLIHKWVIARRAAVVDSVIVRDKGQVRWLFSDKTALYLTFDERERVIGAMTVLLGHTPNCMWSGEDSSGNEVILMGGTDGMVYQMEKGTSFDGDAIEAFQITHYDHAKSPRIEKSYRSGILEVAGDGYAEFTLAYELGYTSSDIPQPMAVTHDVGLSAARWDSFTWDSFYWDGVQLTPEEFELDGDAENISFIIRSNADYFDDFEISGALYRYLPRRQMR